MEDRKYYISIDGTLVEVSKEVYQAHTRSIANERARARRDHKCGQPDYRKCRGDCGHCPWVLEGTNMLSLTKAFQTDNPDVDTDETPEESCFNSSAPLIEDMIADRELLSDLFKKMDRLVPDGGRIVQMLMDEYSEREIAQQLGVSRQSTINYRTRKLKEYLRQHWNDFFPK